MCQLDGTLAAGTVSQQVSSTSNSVPDLVPQDSVSQAAYSHVKQHIHPAILAHSLRVFFYATRLAARQPARSDAWHSPDRQSLLFTACIFHDFGACSLHDHGPYRFEVEGADAAVAFLASHRGISEADKHDVWVAIACHTSPHIGERISTLAKIVREAALTDFHRLSDVLGVSELPEDVTTGLFVIGKDVKQIEEQFPRDNIEKVLADSIVAQAQHEGDRGKAPGGSWPGDLLRAAEQPTTMLALPLIPPPSDQSSWHEDTYTNDTAPLSAAGQTQAHHHRQQRQQRDEEKRSLQARSPLALLAADEAAIAQRKAAIRNFGAYWIRPPGISKTLQSMIEEEVERREQEELERQERGLQDLQAQQELEEAQQRAAETAAEQEAGDVTEDHDLDDDVPEADEDATFNEDSMLEGSQREQEQYEELEEAELLGIARDEDILGIEHERNLDDSVPEAAAYQSSEEAESTSEESELEDSFALPNTRPAGPTAGIFDRTRLLQQSLGAGLVRSPGSMTLSSPQVESSFAASSPVQARSNRDARGGRRGHS